MSIAVGTQIQAEGRETMTSGWMAMTGFGVVHWIFFVIMVILIVYPIGRILGRVGLSPFWSVLALIPLVNLIGLWVLAFVDWPGKSGSTDGP